jgi:hypothetical protein
MPAFPTPLPATGTLLVLSQVSTGGLLIPLYAARGLTQTLKFIRQAADIPRTVNGGLVDLGQAQFRKFASSIECKDFAAALPDGVWPGDELTVSCVAELRYLTAGGAPSRPVVDGSAYVSGAWTFYRPQLTMRVMDAQLSADEYAATGAWRLELEEV